MSEATGAPAFRPGEIRQAICSHCGEVVRVHAPDFRAREVRLWWPLPLALIIWLALVWKFSYLLTSPRVEMAASALVQASFVELPDAAKEKSPEAQPKSLPRPSKPAIRPRSKTLPSPDTAAARPAPPQEAVPEPNLAPPTDLMAYVNAAKERRHAAEAAAGRENAAATARERGPSEEQAGMANIMRNLQPQGTNGVFQIVSMSARTAKYSFRGWTKNAGNARQELIEVTAGPDGDVERAIVRSMIGLIRRYYKGDFNWESQRLARTIVLSARIEDSAGLEDFMMREFFLASGRPHGLASR